MIEFVIFFFFLAESSLKIDGLRLSWWALADLDRNLGLCTACYVFVVLEGKSSLSCFLFTKQLNRIHY